MAALPNNDGFSSDKPGILGVERVHPFYGNLLKKSVSPLLGQF